MALQSRDHAQFFLQLKYLTNSFETVLVTQVFFISTPTNDILLRGVINKYHILGDFLYELQISFITLNFLSPDNKLVFSPQF